MRVLWFEITTPKAFLDCSYPLGGWQDSLQELLVSQENIELGIAFEYAGTAHPKEIGGVQYYPICTKYSFIETIRKKRGWNIVVGKLLSEATQVVDVFKPDIIHVFGTEWPFGLIAERVNVPVVIHMQGCIAPYNNALLPPRYGTHEVLAALPWWNVKRRIAYRLNLKNGESRQDMEAKVFKSVKHYMGRTEWDRRIVNALSDGGRYYYCGEALRSVFVNCPFSWRYHDGDKIKLVTVGVSTFWKGLDTIIRCAKLLKNSGVDFEWVLVGDMNYNKEIVERIEKGRFAELNCIITGFVNSERLIEILLSSDIYVHAAYIDNSPNSICEAQYLGLPVVATYVGGIPSLISNGENGILIPANDPYTMSSTILELRADREKCLRLGESARLMAMQRHRQDKIVGDLMSCYSSILQQV